MTTPTKTLRSVVISGTGSYAPEKVLTNADMEKLVDTSNEWIVQRTGIKERRMVAAGESTSDLCERAARKALDAARVAPAEINMIIVATISPDMLMPSTACFLQRRLGAHNAGCYDLSAACSGFVYGLVMASSTIASGAMNKVLVVGAESLTRFLDFKDRASCILFGDGAGAAVVEVSADGKSDVLYTEMGSDGTQAEVLWIPGGGSRWPACPQTLDERKHYISLDGKAIYKFAVKKFVDLIENSAKAMGIAVDEIDFIVPHQVNLRIIESAIEKLKFPMDRVMVNIDRYGNTSAGSVPIALDEAVRAGRIERGDRIVLPAFGAGLTWGCVALRW